METKKKRDMMVILLVIFISVITNLVDQFPWWFDLIPIVILGALLSRSQWSFSAFTDGFLAGFLVWTGANLFFSLYYQGDILSKLGMVLSIPKFLVFVVSGIIGGVLAGLALLTGATMFYNGNEEIDVLEKI